jgi:conjugative relaxase-like TrwC/TraI family protein
MQTTHKIPGDSAVTYARYLTSTSTRGDYYARDGEGEEDRPVPSRWHGSQKTLASLGLSAEGPVDRRDLRAVMRGRSPLDGEPLRPAGSNGTRTAGVELMMAPPKSVSALWAAADPYRREQIEAAHRKAVASALERTEREVELVRRKSNGVVRFEKSERLLAAEFVHTSSRLARDQEAGAVPDPQLHSHLIVFAAERKDGKLAAVESKQLYRAARENGAWYRAELAENLRELGLPIDRRTGKNERYFEVKGVPEELAGRWSSRSEDIDRAAALFRRRYGREPRAGELGSLTTGTRGSKSAADRVDVNDAWRALAAEHGLTKQQVHDLFNDRRIDNRPAADLAKELLGEAVKERATIAERELRAKAYELSAGVCRPAEADRVVEELARSGELVRLQDRTWTTRAHRDLEQTTLDIAARRAAENAAPVGEEALKQARREIGREIKGSLTSEQREALETITGSGGVTVLVGRAGTGKGVVLAAAAKAWQLEGNEVIGTAVAGATAQRLQAEAKLDRSLTADGLVNGVENGRVNLGPKSVVVMDEAGMADSARLSRLVKATAERESKLVLAGDAAQLSSIGPGGLFKEIEVKAPTAELVEVHRARHEWERTAWEQIRNGEPGPALAQYRAHGRLHIHDTRAQAAEAMVAEWAETSKSLPDGRKAVMITDASNRERDQINAMAQEHRAEAGELGAHRVELPGKPYGFAAGDHVIFTAQHPVPGDKRVENGITGTIVHTGRGEDERRVTITTDEREPRDVNVDTARFSDVSLAYAVHVHKAQGLTAETSGILTGSWQTDREHAYVAVSRAREETHIHVTREDLGEQGMDTGAIERLADRMRRSEAQEASITKQAAERTQERERTAAIEAAEPGREHEPPAAAETAERSQTQETGAALRPDAPDPDRGIQPGDPADPDPAEHHIDRAEDAGRDPWIEQAIKEARERREAREHGIEQDREHDRGFGID